MAMAIEAESLESVGLSSADVQRFAELEPRFVPLGDGTPESRAENFPGDADAASRFFRAGQALLDRLPPRAQRSEREQAAVEALTKRLREVRVRFLRLHAGSLYAQLTYGLRNIVRIEDL